MSTLTRARPVSMSHSPMALAHLATQALLDEADLSEKPGLVGPDHAGAHGDMDIDTMHASALVLEPWFERMAVLGATDASTPDLRTEAAALGRDAERAMLAVTGGVNTHRGAIWALGLLTVAAARLASSTIDGQGAHGSGLQASRVTDIAARIARQPDAAGEQARRVLPGGRACRAYGVGGAVAEAAAAFPHARLVAASLAAHADPLLALFVCMSRLDDTCLLHRGGPGALVFVQRRASRIVALGVHSDAGIAAREQLGVELRQLRLSPGGSADMLAAGLFLHWLGGPDARSGTHPSDTRHRV